MQKQGSTMLKVVSIIMIIFSALGVCYGVLMAAMVTDVSSLSGTTVWELLREASIAPAPFALMLICLFLAAVLELIAGIVGVASWYKKEKAGTCIVLGWLIIILLVAGMVFEGIFIGQIIDVSTVFQSFATLTMGSILGGMLGLVLPVLYLIGASKLKNLQPQPMGPYGYYNGYGYGQGYPGQWSPTQPYGGQPYPGQQNYPGQNNNYQNYGGQGYPGQNWSGPQDPNANDRQQ